MADFLFLSAVVFAAGVLRGITGFGFALAAVPMMSLYMSPLASIITAHLLQLVMAPIDLAANHRHLDRPALGYLFIGALLGTPLGVLLATDLPPDLLRLAIAVVVLIGLVAILTRLRLPTGPVPSMAAGGVSGLFAGLAAMPGPPVIAYFIGRGSPAVVTRASSLIFFALTAAMALAAFWASGDLLLETVLHGLLALPALILGSWCGGWIFRHMADDNYRLAAVGVLAVSALLTGVKGLSGLL